MNNSLPGLADRASVVADRFEPLFWYIVAWTALGTLLVCAGMAFCCIKYRRTAASGSTPRILGSHRLELFWTLTPLLIFLTFFVWGAWVYDSAVHPPKDAPEIKVIGKQWMWKAQYPEGQRVIIGGNPGNMTEEERANIGALVLPVDRPVKVTFISEDVIHDFGIPAFRQKIDVLPGRYVSTWYHPTKVGEYHVFCDQYCGTWHSLMVGKIKVVPQDEFDRFLREKADGSLAWEGQQLFRKLQCIDCHSPNAESGTKLHPRAPSLEGLYGRTVPLRGGGTVVADESYIRESILNPRAKVVEGWEPIMPGNYESQVSEDDLIKVIAYIRSLKQGGMIPPNERFPAPDGAPRNTPTPPTTPSGSPGGKP
ncbi:MAG: ctaC 1 [Gemmataceae bacterium]|nr:ctaC 1 [Gemmataceae bacterium]